MSSLQEKITVLKSFGIKLNSPEITDLEKLLAFYEAESDDYPEYWLIIRELGNPNFLLEQPDPLSSNVSNIIYEDFISHFLPSHILKELERISNGAFKYSVVNEFSWTHTYFTNPNDSRSLEYIVDGKTLKYEYVPYRFDSGSLNAEWLFQLLNDLQEDLYKADINYQINDDSVTFICISKENQKKLIAADLGLGVNLIPALME